MASTPRFILYSIYVALISVTVSFAEANNGDDFKFPSNNFPKTQAEKLIRALNLFPKYEMNHHSSPEHDFGSSRIVEKRFKFPFMADSGDSVQTLGHYAGYYRLPNSTNAKMFYFFFKSRVNLKNYPLVIWLSGGPGCSSELALFYENGPFHITNNLTLTWNYYGWDKVSNLLYVDQPTGTGFSYSSDVDDIRHNEEGVSNDLYDFMQAFFKKHLPYTRNAFYITGESYAGHYIPAFASRILQGNKKKEARHINLRGIAIGNGLTDPEIQYGALTDYALDMNLIQQSDHDSMNTSVSDCQQAIKLCGADGGSPCVEAYMVCNKIFDHIVNLSGDKNYFDVRIQCDTNTPCYNFSNMRSFLNLKSVKDALGVGDINFALCNSTVYRAMISDWMRNLEVGIPALLEDGIKLLVYAGEYDLICNWLGNSRWVHAMEWSGQKKFEAAKTTQFSVDGKKAGCLKGYGPLTFLKVLNAGHLVPMDQPKVALRMLSNWMHGRLALTQPDDHLAPM